MKQSGGMQVSKCKPCQLCITLYFLQVENLLIHYGAPSVYIKQIENSFWKRWRKSWPEADRRHFNGPPGGVFLGIKTCFGFLFFTDLLGQWMSCFRHGQKRRQTIMKWKWNEILTQTWGNMRDTQLCQFFSNEFINGPLMNTLWACEAPVFHFETKKSWA